MIGTFTEWINDSNVLDEASNQTNSPIPTTEDVRYSKKIIKLLRMIEKANNGNLVLSYSSNRSITSLRYVVTAGSVCCDVLVNSKNDRSALYNSIMAGLVKVGKCEPYQDDDEIQNKVIYIRPTKRNQPTIASLYNGKGSTKVPTNFSSAGGIEFYDSESNTSYLVDFELKGSARTDSAVNTKLREVTPCVLFELFCIPRINPNKLNKIFRNPSASFDEVSKKIMGLNSMTPGLSKSLGCDLDTLQNCFNFQNDATNGFRIKAYNVGVNTLKIILDKYNKPLEGKTIKYIKYTGLTTMASRSESSTEDIIVVTTYDKNTDTTQDVKISLKSGPHKTRENTFITFLKNLNLGLKMEPNTKTRIENKTLYLKGKKTDNGGFLITEKDTVVADKFFELINKQNKDPNRKKFADAIKNMILPDINMEIWNVTEDGFTDLKSEYMEFYNYKFVNLVQKKGTHYYIIEMSNKLNDKKKNTSFRLRWYKRDGDGMASLFKILAEPNKQ